MHDEKMDLLLGYRESDADLVRIRQELRDDPARETLEEPDSGGDTDPARAGDPSFQASSGLA